MPATNEQTQGQARAKNNPLIVIMAGAGFAAAIFGSLFLSGSAIGPAIAVTLGATIVQFVCLFLMRGDDRYRVVRHSGDIDFDAMSSMLGGGSFLHKAEMSSAEAGEVRMAGYVSNPTVDRLFATNPYYVEVVGRYQLPSMMLPYVRYLAADVGEGDDQPEDDQSDSIIGLAGDLTTAMLATGKNIPVTVATTQDMSITDGAFDRVVATTGLRGTIVFDGCSMSIAEGGFLLPTSQSGNVNAVTAHSLVLTSDGYIAFMQGTDHDPHHEGKVVPSVSCLVHLSDIEAAASFQDAIVMAVHKAVRAEYSLGEQVPVGSSVLGLARIIENNGATEFYAITRVGQTMAQLIAGHANRKTQPAATLMKPWLSEAVNDLQLSETLSRVAYTMMDSSSISMSVSMAALSSALFEAMGNNKVRGRIMHRLGYSQGANPTVTDATEDLMDIAADAATMAREQNPADATGGMSPAMMMARQLTFGNMPGTGSFPAVGGEKDAAKNQGQEAPTPLPSAPATESAPTPTPVPMPSAPTGAAQGAPVPTTGPAATGQVMPPQMTIPQTATPGVPSQTGQMFQGTPTQTGQMTGMVPNTAPNQMPMPGQMGQSPQMMGARPMTGQMTPMQPMPGQTGMVGATGPIMTGQQPMPSVPVMPQATPLQTGQMPQMAQMPQQMPNQMGTGQAWAGQAGSAPIGAGPYPNQMANQMAAPQPPQMTGMNMMAQPAMQTAAVAGRDGSNGNQR